MITKFSEKQLKAFEKILLEKKDKAELQIKDIDDQLNFMAANGRPLNISR